MFGEAVVKIGPVCKVKGFFQIGVETHFFHEPPVRGFHAAFARKRVAAAAVCPEARAVVFVRRPLLEQDFTLVVKDEYAECAVQESLPVGFHFLHRADGFVRFIHQYDLGGVLHHDVSLKNVELAAQAGAYQDRSFVVIRYPDTVVQQYLWF